MDENIAMVRSADPGVTWCETEVATLARLLAVLEAARGVDRWKRTTTVGPYGDPLGLFRVENELVLALAACDADPLLAPKANTEA